MGENAFFKVDTKLAELLGETYRSTEYALKELIDNAYDADAESVEIHLPEPLAPNPMIKIIDDGAGMKENEIRSEYLNVANSRLSRKGDTSFKKKRKVKGRKGIGKFSGLMVAETMQIETMSSGVKSTLIIDKEQLSKGNNDIEKIPLSFSTEVFDKNKHGTVIALSGLNQNLNFPNPARLKEILMRDYGRETDFSLTINGEKLNISDLIGKSYEGEISIDGNKAVLRYTITDNPIKQSGIAIKVNNKTIGKPINFLEEDEVIPKKLQNRIYGEIVCDALEDDVTADWGAVIENSKLYQGLSNSIKGYLKNGVDKVFTTDMKMARARYQKKINNELEKLPEYKQPYARKALFKTLEKFYGETEDRINTVISVMVSAMEKDHYWDIIQSIQETDNSDIEKLADALSEFGLLEMSIVSSQAINRLKFLDELNILIEDPKTLEKTIHKALENNTWVLGEDYSVLFSDIGLKSAIEKVLGKKYTGDKDLKRPDLLLGKTMNKELYLIEFKRPNFTIDRVTEMQAQQYRDELNQYYPNQKISIMLLGGKVDKAIDSINKRSDIQFETYLSLTSSARNRLEWLLEELGKS